MQTPQEYIRYVDLPEVSETFVDHLQTILFDGTTLRLELCVTRMEEPRPPNPMTATRYPTCRLVMPAPAMLELYNQLTGLIRGLEEQGVLTKNPLQQEPPLTRQ